MKNRKEFGKFLKEHRQAAGVTQAEVSKELGFSSPQFISNIERGICAFPMGSGRKWAEMIKMKPKEFLNARFELLKAQVEKQFYSGRH